MKRKSQGIMQKSSLVAGEPYNAYVPNPLPPSPPIELAEIAEWNRMAIAAIDALNDVASISTLDPSIINYMYLRKEALLSSQIEGIQSSLDDLLRYESELFSGVPVDDVEEVSSYVAALSHGLKRIAGGFPLSLRLIREIHRILLENSRGWSKAPGEFRTSQNWIGGTRPGNARFVPPPPDRVPGLMSDLEKLLYRDDIPPLIRAALTHQQFETIHPFLDGNGRTGRLLITLYLCERGFLRSPFLYLSLFFKKNRELYYEKLNAVRNTGDWEGWLNFFLEGVAETANDARATLVTIQKLFEADDAKVASLKRPRITANAVFTQFKQKPLLTITEIAARTELAYNTASSSVRHLASLGIIKSANDEKRGQIYSYTGYIALLTPGTGASR